MGIETKHFEGRVLLRPEATGTKSEHDAIVLETRQGTFLLRRVGGSAYRDPELVKLINRQISCLGALHQGTLILTSWQIISGK